MKVFSLFSYKPCRLLSQCKYFLNIFPAGDAGAAKILRIVNANELQDKQKHGVLEVATFNLQLTQLVDTQGNPISITTQDGQNIPVVTNGEENIIQGLLPNGTLVPINLEKNMMIEVRWKIIVRFFCIITLHTLIQGVNLKTSHP